MQLLPYFPTAFGLRTKRPGIRQKTLRPPFLARAKLCVFPERAELIQLPIATPFMFIGLTQPTGCCWPNFPLSALRSELARTNSLSILKPADAQRPKDRSYDPANPTDHPNRWTKARHLWSAQEDARFYGAAVSGELCSGHAQRD